MKILASMQRLQNYCCCGLFCFFKEKTLNCSTLLTKPRETEPKTRFEGGLQIVSCNENWDERNDPNAMRTNFDLNKAFGSSERILFLTLFSILKKTHHPFSHLDCMRNFPEITEKT